MSSFTYFDTLKHFRIQSNTYLELKVELEIFQTWPGHLYMHITVYIVREMHIDQPLHSNPLQLGFKQYNSLRPSDEYMRQ